MKLFIIIRGAKERTESLCVSVAKDLVGSDNVILLNESSFALAHIKSMEIGASLKGFDYVIFLDADILLIKDGFFNNIKQGINKLKDDNFYMLNYQLFDRQCKTPVYGMHLYNIKTLKKALSFKKTAIEAQRPETAVCIEMAKKGYKTYQSTVLVGLHGYEQYYLDMYRTAFVRGVKYHRHWDFYMATFYKNKKQDLDFFWSYIGLVDGIVFYSEKKTKASLSKEKYIEKFNNHLKELNLKEKEPLIETLYDYKKEIKNLNPLFKYNKGWLVPSEVGFNETNKAIKFFKKIYKRIRAKLF